MSTEEIIKSLTSEADVCEELAAHTVDIGVKQKLERKTSAFREATALLRTHPEAQPNEPLTLEELRDMVGTPVWVETPGVDRELSGRWVIVAGASPEDGALFCAEDFNCWDYGRVWLAYRRPPKED